MKAHFCAIILLAFSLVGLKSNAMESENLDTPNERTSLFQGNSIANGVDKGLTIKMIFGSINKSKKDLSTNRPCQQKSLCNLIKLVCENPLFITKDLNAKSKYSGRTLLQELTYHLLPNVIEKILLFGADPSFKGKKMKPSEMLEKRKISQLLKTTGKLGQKASSLKVSNLERFIKCRKLVSTAEKCWEHRDECNFCKKLYSGLNDVRDKKNKNSCEHYEDCFLCKSRLEKTTPKIKNKKCKKKK